jgi:hypothetical protein
MKRERQSVQSSRVIHEGVVDMTQRLPTHPESLKVSISNKDIKASAANTAEEEPPMPIYF